jgi:uncharacterized protein YhbP (UPF0306 family)
MPELADLYAFLDAHHVAHLATAGEGGPHAAAVFFARVGDGAAITWISAPHVLHSRHLAVDPTVAASISPSAPGLGRIEGVQLRGRVRVGVEEARDAWLARFPDARAMIAGDHRFYVLEPVWARFVRTIAGVSCNREWSLAR